MLIGWIFNVKHRLQKWQISWSKKTGFFRYVLCRIISHLIILRLLRFKCLKMHKINFYLMKKNCANRMNIQCLTTITKMSILSQSAKLVVLGWWHPVGWHLVGQAVERPVGVNQSKLYVPWHKTESPFLLSQQRRAVGLNQRWNVWGLRTIGVVYKKNPII